MSKTYRSFVATSLDKKVKEGKKREVARRLQLRNKAETKLFKREVNFVNYIMQTTQED